MRKGLRCVCLAAMCNPLELRISRRVRLHRRTILPIAVLSAWLGVKSGAFSVHANLDCHQPERFLCGLARHLGTALLASAVAAQGCPVSALGTADAALTLPTTILVSAAPQTASDAILKNLKEEELQIELEEKGILRDLQTFNWVRDVQKEARLLNLDAVLREEEKTVQQEEKDIDSKASFRADAKKLEQLERVEASLRFNAEEEGELNLLQKMLNSLKLR